MIRLEQVTVVYGRTVALDRLDLELEPGITGLFGQNGTGKTTMLRVLAGLLAPSSGIATFDGRPISLADEDLRRRLGYAGHASGLYPRLSLQENLSLFAQMYGVGEGRAADAISWLQLEDHAHTPVGALSAGLKRRAAVARAMLHDPDVLLLDEPYANVDEEASRSLSAAVIRWAAPGRLAVIATHGAKKVKPFAHRGVILKEGRAILQTEYSEQRARSGP